MIARLTDGLPPRALALLAIFAAVMAAAPHFVSDYVLSVLIISLYFAFVGQAWNLMLGFAGQLSLGHALFVGIGAYTSAALFIEGWNTSPASASETPIRRPPSSAPGRLPSPPMMTMMKASSV